MSDQPETNYLAAVGPAVRGIACRPGLREPDYGGPLRRHVEDGDVRLLKLRLDNSAASLAVVELLALGRGSLAPLRRRGQEARRHDEGSRHRAGHGVLAGQSGGLLSRWRMVAAMPCWRAAAELLEIADSLGIDDSFCPVRAMLGAFVSRERFPIPGLLTCSVGATCDDFSAIAQRLGIAGFSDPVVGSSPPPPSRRRARRPSNCPAASGACRAGRVRRNRNSNACGRHWKHMPDSRSATSNSRPASPGPTRSVAVWRELRQTGFHRQSLPVAGPGDAGGGDACDPFLFRS